MVRDRSIQFARAWALIAITLLALLLRLAWLGGKSLWLDEIWSLEIARLSWRSLSWSIVHQDPNMSLYYGLLHVWLGLGSSEAVLRLLSALLGTATIPIVYFLGKALRSHFAGLCAAYLLAINGFHVQWSQEVRSYTLAVFLVSLSALLLVVLRRNPRPAAWFAYVAASALAVYSHVFAVFVLAAHGLCCIASGRTLHRKYCWSAIAAAGLLALPLLILVWWRAHEPFVPLSWLAKPGLHDVTEVFHRLSGSPEIMNQPGGRMLPIAYFVLCLAALWAHLRRIGGEERPVLWRHGLLLGWLFLPVVTALAASFHQPIFVPRYFLICLPALVLLAAEGLEAFKPGRYAYAALMVMSILAGLEAARYFAHRHHIREWQAVTASIAQRERPGDAAVFCVGPARLLFEYYRQADGRNKTAAIKTLYPPDPAGNEAERLAYLPPLDPALLSAGLRSHDRVWLVLYNDQYPAPRTVKAALEAVLSAGYPEMEEARIGTVSVRLYTRRRGS